MKLSVNRAVVNKSKDFETLTVKFVNEDLTKEQLAREIDAGHAFSTQHEGRRQQDNFRAAGYVALDFDRSNPEEVKYILSDPIVSRYYGIFYYTFSSTPENPKFRILFELEKTIYDRELYRKIVAAFIWRFEANVDSTCSDPCRLFYGAKDSRPISTEKILPMSVVNNLLESHSKFIEQENRIKEEAAAARFAQASIKSNGNGHNSSDKGKKAYIDKVLESLCDKLRATPKGERHHTLRKYSRTMGGYLAAYPNLINETEVKNKLADAYSVHPDLNKREMISTINYGVNHGLKEPFFIPDLPDYKNIIDFSDWAGPATQQPKVDPETGEVLEGEVIEPKKETFEYFPLYTFEELANLPKPSWLIEPILVRGYLTCVYGPTQTAKSFLMLDLALKVAAAGFKVIYVIAESANGYYARANAWYQYHNEIPNNNIRFIPMPVQLLLPEQVYRLEKTIDTFYQEDLPAFIIFDTLSKCYLGGDENDAKDMRQFVSACDNLRRKYNATVGVVHHAPKVGGSPRGSSVITGDFDTIIETAKKVDNDQKLITVKCEKQKDAKEFGTKLYRLQTTGELFDFEDSCVLVEENEVDNNGNYQAPDRLPALGYKILETLNQSAIESEGLTSAKLMSILEIDPKTEKSAKAIFFRVLSKIVDLNLVTKVITGRTPVFKITTSGKDFVMTQSLS